MFLFQEFIHVHVRDVSVLWSSMFRIMEDIRDEFPGVEDYSISETSLEQVFISFARDQKSTEKTGKSSKNKNRITIARLASASSLNPKVHRHLIRKTPSSLL